MIEIRLPGPIASVQDLGRVGHRAIGVGVAGAMDATALRIGNMLVGNAADCAGIEFTLGGFALRFLRDTVFALTGAHADARLDGDPVPAWWVRQARAGQELRAGMARRGMRTILAVAGGIDVPPVMGARATDLKGGFGGHQGRLLRTGDRLPLGPATPPTLPERGFGLSAARLGLLPPDATGAVIRFLPAAEWQQMPKALHRDFTARDWTLRPDSNRMGYRFDGRALAPARAFDLHSHGILPGTIQLPPDGFPVIQMQDANTCGGYPKLGVVIAADLPRLAQLRLGGTLRFAAVDRATALAAAERSRILLDRVARQMPLARDHATRMAKLSLRTPAPARAPHERPHR